jgi:hypothetical protein
MKKQTFAGTLVLMLFFLSVLNLGAFSLLDQGFQTRAAGMGNAFTALCDDSSALFYNPALLYGVPRHQVSIGYSRLFSTANLYSVSYALPKLKYNSGSRPSDLMFGVSAGFSTIRDEGIPSYSGVVLGSPGDYVKGTDSTYYENLVMAGFGALLRKSGTLELSSGITLKYFDRKFSDLYSYGIGFDLAVNAGHRYFDFGVVLRNILTQINSGTKIEPLPMSLRLGALLKLQNILKGIEGVTENRPGVMVFDVPAENINLAFNLVCDGEVILDQTTQFNLFSGIEAWLNDFLALRTGYNTVNGFSVGGSVQLSRVRLDYTYMLHPELDQTQKITGTFYF